LSTLSVIIYLMRERSAFILPRKGKVTFYSIFFGGSGRDTATLHSHARRAEKASNPLGTGAGYSQENYRSIAGRTDAALRAVRANQMAACSRLYQSNPYRQSGTACIRRRKPSLRRACLWRMWEYPPNEHESVGHTDSNHTRSGRAKTNVNVTRRKTGARKVVWNLSRIPGLPLTKREMLAITPFLSLCTGGK